MLITICQFDQMLMRLFRACPETFSLLFNAIESGEVVALGELSVSA